jgi:hypothetical protein
MTSPELQAAAILSAIGRWLEGGQDRRVTISHTPDGWRAMLDARQASRGESLVDALAQVAQVAELEAAEPVL